MNSMLAHLDLSENQLVSRHDSSPSLPLSVFSSSWVFSPSPPVKVTKG